MRFRDPERKDWTLVSLDTTAKREETREALTRIFDMSGGKPDSIQVSPDGKWMLWTGAKGGTLVSTTDGRTHFELPPGKPSEKRWMCDSLRWIELLHDDEYFNMHLLHSVLKPSKNRQGPLLPPVPYSTKFVNVAGMAATTDDHILASL